MRTVALVLHEKPPAAFPRLLASAKQLAATLWPDHLSFVRDCLSLKTKQANNVFLKNILVKTQFSHSGFCDTF